MKPSCTAMKFTEAVGCALVVVEQVVGGGEAARELAAVDAAAQPVAAHGVAEAVVPFQEAAGEAADLVAVGTGIPGFGDQARAGQHRILAQRGEEGRAADRSRGRVRPSTGARSKRKPSTPISRTQ